MQMIQYCMFQHRLSEEISLHLQTVFNSIQHDPMGLAIRTLVIWLDQHLSFRPHLTNKSQKILVEKKVLCYYVLSYYITRLML